MEKYQVNRTSCEKIQQSNHRWFGTYYLSHFVVTTFDVMYDVWREKMGWSKDHAKSWPIKWSYQGFFPLIFLQLWYYLRDTVYCLLIQYTFFLMTILFVPLFVLCFIMAASIWLMQFDFFLLHCKSFWVLLLMFQYSSNMYWVCVI